MNRNNSKEINLPRITHKQGLRPFIFLALLNLIFLLVLFGFVSTQITSPNSIIVKLPKAFTSDIIKKQNIVIVITSEDVIYFNDKITTIGELRHTLGKAVDPEHSIFIKVDRRARVSRIVDIWNLCRELGLENINMATN